MYLYCGYWQERNYISVHNILKVMNFLIILHFAIYILHEIWWILGLKSGRFYMKPTRFHMKSTRFHEIRQISLNAKWAKVPMDLFLILAGFASWQNRKISSLAWISENLKYHASLNLSSLYCNQHLSKIGLTWILFYGHKTKQMPVAIVGGMTFDLDLTSIKIDGQQQISSQSSTHH